MVLFLFNSLFSYFSSSRLFLHSYSFFFISSYFSPFFLIFFLFSVTFLYFLCCFYPLIFVSFPLLLFLFFSPSSFILFISSYFSFFFLIFVFFPFTHLSFLYFFLFSFHRSVISSPPVFLPLSHLLVHSLSLLFFISSYLSSFSFPCFL